MKKERRAKKPKKTFSNRSTSRALDIAIIVLAIALVLVISVGTIKDKRTFAKGQSNYNVSSESSNKGQNNEEKASSNAYEKNKGRRRS